MAFCSNCGKKIPHKVSFCPYCGERNILQRSSFFDGNQTASTAAQPKTGKRITIGKPGGKTISIRGKEVSRLLLLAAALIMIGAVLQFVSVYLPWFVRGSGKAIFLTSTWYLMQYKRLCIVMGILLFLSVIPLNRGMIIASAVYNLIWAFFCLVNSSDYVDSVLRYTYHRNAGYIVFSFGMAAVAAALVLAVVSCLFGEKKTNVQNAGNSQPANENGQSANASTNANEYQ